MNEKWMQSIAVSMQVAAGSWLLTSQIAMADEAISKKVRSPQIASAQTEPMSVAQAEPVQITDVQLQETPDGVRLQLITDSEVIAPETSVSGNVAIAEIPNAVLNLAEGDRFLVSDPATGIDRIEVSNVAENRVRIVITGTEAAPVAEIGIEATQLTFIIVPEAEIAAPPTDEPIEIVITAEDALEDPYFVPSAGTATGTDTPILETPASIQVIPQEILEEQQALDLGDALQNTSGASVSSTEGRGFQINLRGFEGVPVYRDGFRLYSPNDNGDAAGQGFPELANIERIEILRGPASILFGQIEPGGVVNVIPERPLAEPFYEVGLQVGSDDLIRPQIDFSGPLTGDGRVLYRLNAVYQHQENFRDYNEDIDRFFVSPALTFQIGDRTDLNLQLEYLDDERAFDPGLVAFGDGIADIPRDRVLGEPDDFIESEFISVGYDFEHEFSDSWTLNNAFRYIESNDDIRAALSFPFIGGLDESTGTLNRVFAEQEVTNETVALQTNVVGEFATGAIEHTLIVGADFGWYDLDSESFTDFSVRTPLNIFDPQYNAIARPDRLDDPTSSEQIETNTFKLYLQDSIEILDNLTLVAGLNYETVDQETTTFRGGNTTEADLSDDALNPRLGLVYQPLENLSLYGNYSRSFFPSAAVTVDGDPLEPEEGEGFEFGIKTELFDNRLLATLSYFNLTKENVATADPDDPRFSVATGEQHSQGIEFNAIGQLQPGWNLIASYSYIDAEITEDNRFEEGNRLAGVPEHSASLWTTYEIQSGDLDGLGFGVGFNWVGERQGDLQNSFELDSYFLTNAAIFYERENWAFRLNFQNIFDIDFIQGTPRTRTRGVQPGEPFTILGSLRYEF